MGQDQFGLDAFYSFVLFSESETPEFGVIKRNPVNNRMEYHFNYGSGNRKSSPEDLSIYILSLESALSQAKTARRYLDINTEIEIRELDENNK